MQYKYRTNIINTMILPKELRDAYQEIKEPGSLKRLMKAAKFKSHTHASNVMLGKENTTLKKIEAIKRFIDKNKLVIASLTDDSN